MKKKFLAIKLLALSFLCTNLIAQNSSNKNPVTVFTADSIKSGKTKDVLVSFLQVGLNNLFGTSKAFNFTTNPYEFAKKIKPTINVDTNYAKWNVWRRLNLAFGLKLDSSYKYNGFISGIKFALIDQTDPSTSKNYLKLLQNDTVNFEVQTLNNILFEKLKKYHEAADKPSLFQDIFDEINDFTGTRNVKFKDLKHDIIKQWTKEIIDSAKFAGLQNIIDDTSLTFNSVYAKNVENYKTQLKKAALLTIGFSDTTYNDKFQFSALSFYSEFSKGVFNPRPGKNDFELNAKAAYNFTKDTLQAGRNLQRHILDASANLNWVVRDKQSELPFFEFALGLGYHYVFKGLYQKQGEVQNLFTLNSTMRIRITSDIWLPIEIKYDPKTGNLFGLLNAKINFSALGNLAKAASAIKL